MLRDNIAVVLVKPRFPENIGMAARACANMGCADLRLVAPERWDPLKAEPLATAQGAPVLKDIRFFDRLAPAIGDCSLALATSARLGSQRGSPLSPEQAAAYADLPGKTALVFGPEDRGLTNEELRLCQRLVHIPVNAQASSLNLAQAVLILLYEFRKAFSSKGKKEPREPKFITTGEWNLLADAFRQALTDLECPSGRNPDYFFRQWAGIFKNGRLTRQEFDTLMGFCRRIGLKTARKREAPSDI